MEAAQLDSALHRPHRTQFASGSAVASETVHLPVASTIAMAVALLGYYQQAPNWLLATCLLVLVGWNLYFGLGRQIIILELTALIAVLQNLAGALLAYMPTYDHHKYEMYVDSTAYFTFALPGTAVFVAGLLWPVKHADRVTLSVIRHPDLDKIGFGLLSFAIASAFVSRYLSGMAFFFYLLSQFKYIGTLCLYLSKSEYKWVALPAVLYSGYLTAATSTMFHELLLWLCFFAGFFFLKASRSHVFKLTALAAAILGILLLQSVKAEYRKLRTEGRDVDLTALLLDSLPHLDRAYRDETFRSQAISRLNQGWIISRVMDYVPDEEPFARGETFQVAIQSSLLPRFLAADKAGAGGRDNFRRFTGLELNSQTTMCIGTLGEAYANFGVEGGIVTMLVLGIAYNRIFSIFISLGRTNCYFLLCVPLIFLQPVKAETELVVILNHFVKATMVVMMSYYWLHELFLPGKLSPARSVESF